MQHANARIAPLWHPQGTMSAMLYQTRFGKTEYYTKGVLMQTARFHPASLVSFLTDPMDNVQHHFLG